MANGTKAIGVILAAAACASAAAFPMRHTHRNGGCQGDLTVDGEAVSFRGAKQHAWRWKLEDIREFYVGRCLAVVGLPLPSMSVTSLTEIFGTMERTTSLPSPPL